MRLVLFGVVAFVLGIAGGAGIGIVTAPKPVAVADSSAAHGADSTHAVAASHQSAITRVPAESTAAQAASHQVPGAPVAPASANAGADPSAHPGSQAASGRAGAEPVSPAFVGAQAATSGSEPAAQNAQGAAPTPRDASRTTHDTTPGPEEYKQVARILTNMKAIDAAKILGYLPDELVEGIVRSLGPRQAANLLTQLPPARAAALSRKLLMHRSPEQETP